MGRQGSQGGSRLLEGAGGVPGTAPAAGASRGGHGLRGDEVQVFVIRNLIQVVAILEQLPAHILVHLLRVEEGTISQEAKQK